jgi:hypothetical protein
MKFSTRVGAGPGPALPSRLVQRNYTGETPGLREILAKIFAVVACFKPAVPCPELKRIRNGIYEMAWLPK